MSVRLIRTYRFSASHLYRRPEWSEEENRRRFGKCSIEPGHGHNYRLSIAVTGEVDPQTGFVVDLEVLDRCVATEVLDRVDHRHLNHALPAFASGGLIPSSEQLVLWIRERLEAKLPEAVELVAVRLAEDDDLAAEWLRDG